MNNFLADLAFFLEKIDSYRDKFLFLFIKPYWPRVIVPNYVTSIRIAIGILLFILLFFLGVNDQALIVYLFCIGVFTDLIDGPIARGINKVTELGAMLDSTADRILILPIAVYGLFGSHKWLLLALLLAEVSNTFVSIFYKSKEVYLESNIFGKTKMVLMSAALIAILFFWPSSPPLFFTYVLWLSIPFSFLSMYAKMIELKDKNKIHVPKFKNL
jgi:CDP-diacylglycerol--glycerol-3-phosphate 3-phosphatidyltransferase